MSRADKSLADYIIEVCERGGNLGAFKHVWKEFCNRGKFKDIKEAAIMPYDNTRKKLPWSFIKAVPQDVLDNRRKEYLSLV